MQTRTVSVNGSVTTAPADSPWLRLDTWAGGQIGFQTVVSGTVVYNVETTFQDTDDPFSPVASPVWDSTLSGVDGMASNTSGNIPCIPVFIKINLTSGTGTVAMTVTQSLNAPL